jgi:cyanate permease
VLACHQIGASVVATAAGVMRDTFGNYDLTWYGAGGLCLIAVLCCLAVNRSQTPGVAAPAL